MKPTATELYQACNLLEARIETWRPFKPKEARGMGKVYAKDRKDLTKVLVLLRKENFKEAWTAARNLDTIVRDRIPDVTWELLQATGENHE